MVALLAPPTLLLNLNLKQGAGATITLTVVNSEGQPFTNTSGISARAQIRNGTAGPVLFEWNTAGGAGIGTATVAYSSVTLTSTLTLTLTATQSALFAFTSAQWDCFFTAPGTEPVCLAEGSVTIDPYITH